MSEGVVDKGVDAGVSHLRLILNQDNNNYESLRTTALEQFLQQSSISDVVDGFDDDANNATVDHHKLELLEGPLEVQTRLKLMEEYGEDEEYKFQDAENENDNDRIAHEEGRQRNNHNDSTTIHDNCVVWITGFLLVTTESIYFIASSDSACEYDIRIDGSCIDLHAISSTSDDDDDNENDYDDYDHQNSIAMDGEMSKQNQKNPAIYVQINHEGQYSEFWIKCKDSDHYSNSMFCQRLFEQISKLMSLHPTQCSDDDNDEDGDNNDEMIMMTGDEEFCADDDIFNDAEDEKEDANGICNNRTMIQPPLSQQNDTTRSNNMPGLVPRSRINPIRGDEDDVVDTIGTSDVTKQQRETKLPSEEDRLAMLERLDNLLIVPPEYENINAAADDDEDDYMISHNNNVKENPGTVSDGQFDDADADADENDNEL